jgi:hypothetical protein
MPRSFIDKIAQGTRRLIPNVHKLVTGTPPANSWMHLFGLGPAPAAGTYPGAALAMQQIVGGTSPSISGGIAIVADPTAPNKQYITRSSLKNLVANGKGRLYILDLLVTYKGIDTNSAIAQPFTGSAAGSDQRPRTARRDTQAFLDVTTALAAGAANVTLTYTKTVSLASARSTGAQAVTVSSIVARVPQSTLFLPLQAGDEGIASAQSIIFSAAMGAGGVVSLCLADLIAIVDIATDQDPIIRAHATDQAALIEIPTGAALTYIWEPVSATASQRIEVTHEFSECDLTAA